jgi:hypothetical protein
MDLNLVSDRLAVLALNTQGILRADGFVPASVSEPHFYVGEITLQYDQTFGGMGDVVLLCRVLACRADDEAGQRLLKDFMRPTGPTSLKAALEAGRGEPGEMALDGACDDFHVLRVQNHRQYTVGSNTYIGAEWPVHVIGTESEEE